VALKSGGEIVLANPILIRQLRAMAAGYGAGAERPRVWKVGVLGLLALALISVPGAKAEVSPGNPSDFPRELVLRPEAVPYELENAVWNLDQTNGPFLKEPQLSPQHALHSTLRFGRDTSNAFALIWDQPKQKLYLDLNRNLDLTDDPAGVFSSTNSGFSQLFANVSLPLKTALGLLPAKLDLRLSTDGTGGWVQVRLTARTLWQTKVSLGGEPWQVAVADRLLRPEGPTAAQFLLLRPWEIRTNQVWFDYPLCGMIPFPARLFWLDHAFLLERRLATGDQGPFCQLELAPQQPTLTELTLSGESLCYAMLQSSNGYTVVLRGPAGTVRIPSGCYTVSGVWLKHGAAQARWLGEKPIPVNATTATSLALGAPLTNSVSLERYGRKLVLDYQLKGADGARYHPAQEDRQHPPEFIVYHGGRKVLSGKFRYG
jgi:hypothetical protein